MSAKPENDLIFDLGLHKGYDAEYYLKKGFRVIGLEAAPDLAEVSARRLSAYGPQITVVNKALHNLCGQHVPFYTVPTKDDWGSLHREIAEKGIETAVEISVETIDLNWLFDNFGIPRYIKCDMEGGDLIFRDQLLKDSRRPTFVSIEMNDGQEGRVMEACGYEVGQIVNQWMHPFRTPPNPAREGVFAPAQFNGEMSGLFGLELPKEKWMPLTEIDDIYRRWKELRDLDPELAPGWLDLHVARRQDIE